MRSSDLIDEIVGQAKSNQGNRNDLTLASAEANTTKGKITKRLAEIAKTCLFLIVNRFFGEIKNPTKYYIFIMPAILAV